MQRGGEGDGKGGVEKAAPNVSPTVDIIYYYMLSLCCFFIEILWTIQTDLCLMTNETLPGFH